MKKSFFSIPRCAALAAALTTCSFAPALAFGQDGHVLASSDEIPNGSQSSGQAAQLPAPADATPQKSQQDQASEDLKKEEHQRIFGVVPNFTMMDNSNAPPLTSGQKFHLMLKSSTDPYAFVLAGIVAGIGQAKDSHEEYGQGAQGYFKRFGAAYADAFDGAFWGNAVLPSLLHEDPRYFRKGTGSGGSRVLHAALSTVWCRRDNSTWGPNYANVVGNMIGGAISNAYYPESDRGPGLVFTNTLIVTGEGALGAQLVEFWPDIARKLSHRHSHKTGVVDSTTDTTAPAPRH